jgi:hypothetical protein
MKSTASIDAGRGAEELRGEVLRAAGSDGADVQLARVRLGHRDHVLHALRRRFGPGDDHHAEESDGGDHGEIVHRVVGQRLEERLAHRIAVGEEEKRMAVGLSSRHGLRGADAAGARHVLHDHLLAEPLAQPRGDGAGGDVGDSAGAEGQHDAHGLRGVRLRERHEGRSQDRGQ